MYGRTLISTFAAAFLLAGTAAAQGTGAELSLAFKSATPATPSGLDMDLRYLNPRNREEKPPTIRKLVIHLPAGTRIDPSAVPVCKASNEEIQARGRDACPKDTQIGTGKLDVWLGGPDDPRTTDLALFNGPDQIIEVLLFEGTNNTAALERLPVDGSTISGEPVQVPPGAPPDRRFSASRIVWDIPATGRYLVTPPTCEGRWTTVGDFEFADGSSARAESTQACTTAAAGPDGDPPLPSGIRMLAGPTTLVRGRPTRVRVRLFSSRRECLRGATVRIGRRSARTNADGRATLVALVRWRRPLARVRVSTPDCGAARALLRIRAP